MGVSAFSGREDEEQHHMLPGLFPSNHNRRIARAHGTIGEGLQRLLREAGIVHVEVTGQSNDGGIDGFGTQIINPLVSFKVLFQYKRYANSVTPSLVRNFR